MTFANQIETLTNSIETLELIKNYNREKNICPSENTLIDRIVDQKHSLIQPFLEIEQTYSGVYLYRFFDSTLGATLYWKPNQMKLAREQQRALDATNSKIANLSHELASLLELRTELKEHSGFTSDNAYSIIKLVDQAAEYNGHYTSWVREPLLGLVQQFDLKYWPTISEVVTQLGEDAFDSESYASNPLTAAATSVKQSSKKDFFRAWMTALSEADVPRFEGPFPVSDGSVASLANVLLNLGPDEIVDAAYVKTFRHHEKKRLAVE